MKQYNFSKKYLLFIFEKAPAVCTSNPIKIKLYKIKINNCTRGASCLN